MQSTAEAYLNPERSTRTKSAPSPFNISALISGSNLPRGPRHTLSAIYRAGGNPIGSREILLWPALKGVTIEAQIAERTARYHLRFLEKVGVLEQVYPANARIRPDYIRRTPTYRLNLDRLVARPNYAHYKQNRPLTMPKRPQSVASDVSATPAAPQVVPKPISAPAASRPARKLTSRECSKLVRMVRDFREGCTEYQESHGGLWITLRPGDGRYRAPLGQQAAIEAACQELGAPIESAIDALKLSGWKVGDA